MEGVKFPTLRFIDQIYANRADLLSAVTQRPTEDPIYFFPQVLSEAPDGSTQVVYARKKLEQFDNWVVAGSAAVHPLISVIARYQPKWKVSDTDIFHLNEQGHFRYCAGKTDIVYNPAKTVEELLSNFDLPCCRAAFHPQIGIWISAQCMVSMLYKIYYLPEYTHNKKSFAAMIRKFRHTDKIADPEAFLFKRFCQRIEKYENRGYRPSWIHTDIVLPWIKNRFHYGEWKANV